MSRILVECVDTYRNPETLFGVRRVVNELVSRMAAVDPGCSPVISFRGSYRHVDFRRRRGLRRLAERLRRALLLLKRERRRLRSAGSEPFRLARLAVLRLRTGLIQLCLGLADLLVLLGHRRVRFRPGDVLLALDCTFRPMPDVEGLRAAGARLVTVVYDIIPVTHPHFIEQPESYRVWFDWAMAASDRIVTISRYSRDEIVARWPDRAGDTFWFHLGGDFGAPAPARPPSPAPVFLMVGTMEPRKGHAEVLAALEILWSRGSPAELVILGRPGWMTADLQRKVLSHPELGRRLRWLDDASDLQLAEHYARARALIVASRVEGFGLPVVEALSRGIPVLAADIPVFREIAGEHAAFFPLGRPDRLADLIQAWVESPPPSPAGFRGATWDDSARRLIELLQPPLS